MVSPTSITEHHLRVERHKLISKANNKQQKWKTANNPWIEMFGLWLLFAYFPPCPGLFFLKHSHGDTRIHNYIRIKSIYAHIYAHMHIYIEATTYTREIYIVIDTKIKRLFSSGFSSKLFLLKMRLLFSVPDGWMHSKIHFDSWLHVIFFKITFLKY